MKEHFRETQLRRIKEQEEFEQNKLASIEKKKIVDKPNPFVQQ